MNMAVVDKHIMQVVNWKSRSLEDWLGQLGSWCDGRGYSEKKLVKCEVKKRLTKEQKEILLAQYFTEDEYIERFKKNRKAICSITDSEARAVQRVILDCLQHESDIVKGWVWLVWQHYVEGWSLRDLSVRYGMSTIYLRLDIRCGIAFIAGRNAYLKADLLESD